MTDAAKIIVHAADVRGYALSCLRCDATALHGIETNLDYIKQISARHGIAADGIRELLNEFSQCHTIDVSTRVQRPAGFPGGGSWNIGVPPVRSNDGWVRLAQSTGNNAEDKAGLEITRTGPTLGSTRQRSCGWWGAIEVRLDGEPLATVAIAFNQNRAYAVRNAKDMAAVLYDGARRNSGACGFSGSKSTFTRGQFGGQAGPYLLRRVLMWRGNQPRARVLRRS